MIKKAEHIASNIMNNYKQFILKSKYVILKPFEKKDITKEFLSFLNNKLINKYLKSRKKQNKKLALNYLNEIKKKNNYYWSIIDKKRKKLIGTITIRRINKSTAYIGFMIGKKKYHGSKQSDNSIIMVLDFTLKTLNFKKINAGTEKNNIPATLYITTRFLEKYVWLWWYELKEIIDVNKSLNFEYNGFILDKKKKNTFHFVLNKRNFKRKIKYEISEFNSIS